MELVQRKLLTMLQTIQDNSSLLPPTGTTEQPGGFRQSLATTMGSGILLVPMMSSTLHQPPKDSQLLLFSIYVALTLARLRGKSAALTMSQAIFFCCFKKSKLVVPRTEVLLCEL